ncbi:MAG: hypothetical protein R3D57_18420 [Hyphomicrobiaceae bacterium]
MTDAKTTSASAFDASLFATEAYGEEESEKRPHKQRSDWKKILLVTGLGILSWIATYVGMLELIEANMGSVSLPLKAAIGFSVAMLMLMIIWLLDQIFAPINGGIKLIYVAGYIFLTTISVGFGFGFYWKVLESRTEASRSAESAVTQVQSALHGAETRLSQLITTLDSLAAISTQKAADEVATGRSCPNSRPGDGPRRRLREADANRFSFAASFVKQRIGVLQSDVKALDTDLAKVVMQDASTFDATGTRNEFMRGLGRKLDRTVTSFNAFRTDPQLKQFRADFADRAERTTFSDEKGGTFACPDQQLQAALRGAVLAIDNLPDVTKPGIAAVEGPEATIEAFRRLLATMTGALKFKLPPSADEIRDEQKRAIQSLEPSAAPASRNDEVAVGLGQRDWVPLLSAVFVDLCLLLVSISRPMNRFVRLETKMKEAQEWPVIEVLSKFHAIHVDETIRRTFEVLRHVVFNWRGVYYAAIPLNGGEERGVSKEENERAQLEAYLLNNLFTSFEREQIFKPVPLSMFTAGYIQKKLRQQRSKYAEVEAFRIFKFNNGAWPEMILSAIMGAAKRVEAEQRRMRAMKMAADERAAREQAEAERLAKRARRWRSFIDPLRREPPVLDDGMPELGDVANDMTGKPVAETLSAEPPTGSAGQHPTTSTAALDDDVKRTLDDLAETVRKQSSMLEAQATVIAELTQASKDTEEPEAEPYRQAANGDAVAWMNGSRNGHKISGAARPAPDVHVNGKVKGRVERHDEPAGPALSGERGSRARSYHSLPETPARPTGLNTAGQVIPMPYISHAETPVTVQGSLAPKIEEPAPREPSLLDLLREANAQHGAERIEPLVETVTTVEPFEEWAPAPGLGARPLGAPVMSSPEDVRRFIDETGRMAQKNTDTSATRPDAEVRNGFDRMSVDDLEPGLDAFEDLHPTEQAELNVPMITQWWTRKS